MASQSSGGDRRRSATTQRFVRASATVICERHQTPLPACATRKHEHGDKGSDGRFWASQYSSWCFGGDTNVLVDRVIDYYERVVYPTLAHLPEKSHEWLRTVLISEHQKDADAAAWVLSLPDTEEADCGGQLEDRCLSPCVTCGVPPAPSSCPACWHSPESHRDGRCHALLFGRPCPCRDRLAWKTPTAYAPTATSSTRLGDSNPPPTARYPPDAG